MNPRRRRIKRYRARVRRATLMAESGYVPTRDHLERALPTPLLCDGRSVRVGSTGTAYRYYAHVEYREREMVLCPADVQRGGAFLRAKDHGV